MVFGLEDTEICFMYIFVTDFRDATVGIFSSVIQRRLYMLMIMGCASGTLSYKETVLYIARSLVPPKLDNL